MVSASWRRDASISWPSIVWVLPLPVCPYARTVALKPCEGEAEARTRCRAPFARGPFSAARLPRTMADAPREWRRCPPGGSRRAAPARTRRRRRGPRRSDGRRRRPRSSPRPRPRSGRRGRRGHPVEREEQGAGWRGREGRGRPAGGTPRTSFVFGSWSSRSAASRGRTRTSTWIASAISAREFAVAARSR